MWTFWPWQGPRRELVCGRIGWLVFRLRQAIRLHLLGGSCIRVRQTLPTAEMADGPIAMCIRFLPEGASVEVDFSRGICVFRPDTLVQMWLRSTLNDASPMIRIWRLGRSPSARGACSTSMTRPTRGLPPIRHAHGRAVHAVSGYQGSILISTFPIGPAVRRSKACGNCSNGYT
jgi:hypothetical protein